MSRAWLVLGVLIGACGLTTTIEGQAVDACGGAAYGRAVCLYDAGELVAAAELLQTIVSEGKASPETLRAWYFLARVRMKQGRWEDASRNLIVIHRLSRSFYRDWGCDHLLGQCRKALGKD